MRVAPHSRGIWRWPVRAIALGALAAASVAAGVEPHYHLIKSAVLGGASGWDYITLDPETRRLYVTRGTHVMVVNAGGGRLVGGIGGMKGIHGVAFAHDRGYITDGGSNSVVVFDRRTLKKLRSIPVGQGPDGILYDPSSDRVLAIEGRGGDVTAIDARTDKVAGRVSLDGRPEAGTADGRGMVFINIEDKRVFLVAAELEFPGGRPPGQRPAGPPPAPRAGQPQQRRFVRPSVVPGTFKLLILAP